MENLTTLGRLFFGIGNAPHNAEKSVEARVMEGAKTVGTVVAFILGAFALCSMEFGVSETAAGALTIILLLIASLLIGFVLSWIIGHVAVLAAAVARRLSFRSE